MNISSIKWYIIILYKKIYIYPEKNNNNGWWPYSVPLLKTQKSKPQISFLLVEFKQNERKQ